MLCLAIVSHIGSSNRKTVTYIFFCFITVLERKYFNSKSPEIRASNTSNTYLDYITFIYGG